MVFLVAGSLVYLLLQAWDLRQFLSAGGFMAMSLSEVRKSFSARQMLPCRLLVWPRRSRVQRL